jgi:hypothetical protein
VFKLNSNTKLFSGRDVNKPERQTSYFCVPCSNLRVTTLSPPGLDLSMSAAVQGPPPGLPPHGLPPPGPAMAALVGGPPPLQHLGSRPPPPPQPAQHLHRPLDPGEVPGPPNPDVLLALLSRNKTLEGRLHKMSTLL